MNKHQISLQNARRLVGEDKLQDALQLIDEVALKIARNEESINQILIFKGQLSSLKKANNTGVISLEEKVRAENKLRTSILNLITEIESKITNKNNSSNILKTSPRTQPYLKTIAIIFLLFFAFLGYHFFVFIPNKQDKYIEEQKKIIYESNIKIYLKSAQEWDTLETADEILKLAKFEIHEGDFFSIEFNLANEDNIKYEDIRFFLLKEFMNKLEFSPLILNWKKIRGLNGHIYEARPHFQKDKLFFKVNFLKH